jgi:hypothetical protein
LSASCHYFAGNDGKVISAGIICKNFYRIFLLKDAVLDEADGAIA